MKSQQRRRVRIERGIYRDRWGYSVIVTARGMRREERFPVNVELKTLKDRRDELRVTLRRVAPAAGRGTFAADAERYLQAVAAMPTIAERRKHIELWSAEFGQRARHSIETPEIDAILSRWLNVGLAPSTVRNRRSALLHLWNRLDGTAAPNPVRAALKPQLPEPEARALPYPTIAKILDAMPDVGQGIRGKARDDASKTKARLAVVAYTGLPHALLKRLTPDCIDWRAGTVTVPRRHKGKGAKSRRLPLTARGLAALRRFADLECWGPFSNSSMIKSFHRACDTAKVPRVRVYDLRHSFATELYRQTGDPKATAEMLMHAPSSRMMDRYTLAGVEARLQLATKAFNAAVPAGKIVAVPRGSTSGKHSKTA